MVRDIVNSVPMNQSFTTEWFESTMTPFRSKEKLSIGYVQMVWKNVSANPDANIRIEVTNDPRFTSISGVHQVNSSDNSANSLLVALVAGFRYIRFIYTRNTVIQGQLSININFE